MTRPDLKKLRERCDFIRDYVKDSHWIVEDWTAMLDYIEALETRCQALCDSAEAVVKAHKTTMGEL